MKHFFAIIVSLILFTSGPFLYSDKNSQLFNRQLASESAISSTAKIGLLFGTFDPPHLGHKALALEMKKKFNLDFVYFIPRDKEDYKPGKLSVDVRNELIKLTIADSPSLQLIPSSVAAKVKGLRSEETFQVLRTSFPDNQLSLLLGDDTLDSLNKNHVRIPENFQILVSRRTGYENLELPTHIDGTPVFFSQVSEESSSSYIKKELKEGRMPKELSPNVYRYIKENGLYETRLNSSNECLKLINAFLYQ